MAIVTDVGTGCGGRKQRVDERAGCVRRSRVVLTPRRWRHVLEKLTLLGSNGGKKARSPGRARRKPLKPLRREGRTASAEPVCSCAHLHAFLRTRPRVQRAPGLPRALLRVACVLFPKEARTKWTKPCRENGDVYLIVARMSEATSGTSVPAYRGACHRARIRATRWLMRATNIPSRSRDTVLSEAYNFVRATKRRGRGEGRVRAAPAVSCAFDALEKCAHEHTGSAETLRPSLRNGLTAYTCSPWWPCCATIAGVMRNHHRQLDASLGASGPHDFAVRTASLVL